MTQRAIWRRVSALLAFVFCVVAVGGFALAGTTGTISGTITDAATAKPLAGVTVVAASPSQTQKTTTDSQGFYVLQNLNPDTYTVSYEATGYDTFVMPGVTVQQDLVTTVSQPLAKRLQTIGRVTTRSASNLVKGNQGTDVYNITGQQLTVASGGDNLHKTLYEYIATAPGITSNGFPGLPRIRGGTATDTGYEFDGIPIRERLTGLFTTNLSNVGFGNVEVYTGGLSAANAGNGTGVINSVVKAGTYPGSTALAFGFTGRDQNHYLTVEKGGATRDNRFSYYLAFDGVNSQNQYNYGDFTFPHILYYGYNGPGIVKTRDLIGNFHFRPDQKNDFQFMVQNGLGEFDYNYLLGYGTHLALAPCSGNVATPGSPTGFGGGTAPGGASCPGGFYFSQLAAGQGNMWHHYSGLGKLQWNHVINDHTGITVRLAENFNQYIFDQPLSDPNYASDNAYKTDPGCPNYPIAAGTPVAVSNGSLCSQGVEVFYGDRRSNMWFGSLDYTSTPNQYSTFRIGVGDEYDNNLNAYYNLYGFNSDGSYPQHSTTSIVPTHFPYAYVDATFNVGRFTLEPGLRYSEGDYFFPGNKAVEVVSPTFSGTYRASSKDVLRFSYGNTANFIGTVYVYRQYSTTYDPNKSGGDYSPQVNHTADLMLEHAFSSNTSLRFGPWYRKSNNYFALYKPFLGYNSSGKPLFGITQPTTAGANNVLGLEFGFNHNDPRPVGVSSFVSGTYQNYWTTSISGLTGSYGASQLPNNLVQQGVRVRSSTNPLFDGTIGFDAHAGPWSLLPLFYYQYGTFYNVGVLKNSQISAPESIAPAHWVANATLLRRLDRSGDATVGLRVTNVFDNTKDTTPCVSNGTGCSPFDGPYSGVTTAPGALIYQNYTQNPREFELFFNLKLNH